MRSTACYFAMDPSWAWSHKSLGGEHRAAARGAADLAMLRLLTHTYKGVARHLTAGGALLSCPTFRSARC
jgi:hypothetical protein